MKEKEEIVNEFIIVPIEERPGNTNKDRRSFKILFIGNEGSTAEDKIRYMSDTAVTCRWRDHNNNYLGRSFRQVYQILAVRNFGSATGGVKSD
jgi:hypothetical protein